MKKARKDKKIYSKLSVFEILMMDKNEEDKKLLSSFFSDFSYHCQLTKKDKTLMKTDFENAILYYLDLGYSIEKIISILDLKNLGGFYARSNNLWLPLDDVAKSYLSFSKRNQMAVFRLAANLKHDVNPILLQIALNFTVKRFPYFCMTLREGIFNYYFDSIKRRFRIEEEQSIPCRALRISKTGEQIFRVLYYRNRISVEFFHGMTDGTGALIFLKALLKEYLRLNCIDVENDGTIFDINELPDPKEFENSFSKLTLNGDRSSGIDKPALQLGGKLSSIKPCQIIDFKIENESLLNVVKKYNCSVTTYFVSCLLMASRACIEELSGDVVVSVPINLRTRFESQSLRNFSLFGTVRMPIESISGVKDIIDETKQQIEKMTEKQALIDKLSGTVGITQKISLIPVRLKNPVLKMIYGLFGDNILTTSLSNLGVIKLPKGMKEEVKDLDFVIGTAVVNRAVISTICCNDITSFSISKLTSDPSFEEYLYKLFTDDGIKLIVEGSDELVR